MSEAVILALIASIAAPLVAVLVYLVKTTLADNRDSWKQRAESSEAREEQLKAELLPAVRDLGDGLKRVADGQGHDREAWAKALPVIERLERYVLDSRRGGRDA